MVEAVEIFASVTLDTAIALVRGRSGANACTVSEVYDVDPELAVTVIITATRAVLKENLEDIIDEWDSLTEAHMDELFTRQYFSAQATEQALLVLECAVGMLH